MKTINLDLLKEALPYIQKFKGKIFVIKLSGSIASEAILKSLAEEIVLLHQVGFFPVIVHGGGKQLSDMAARLGIEQTIIEGRRVTNQKTLDLAKMVFVGQINTDITSSLRRFGAKTVGLSGMDGQIILAKKRGLKRFVDNKSKAEREVDFGFVGDVVNVDTKLIRLLLNQGYIPVISSLAADEKGNIFNINADTIAAEIAIGLQSEKLLFLTEINGILKDMDDQSSRYVHLDIQEAQNLITSGTANEGMIPKIQSIIRILQQGIPCVHIVGARVENPLLQEIFTDGGAGTMVTINKQTTPGSKEENT